MHKARLILRNSAFTIVELLVVIVVIGILAAITIVSYSGIFNKAVVVSLQSDLDNASKILKLYNVEYGYFPSSLDENNCPSAPTVDNRYCLKFSSGTAISYTGGGQTFRIDISKSSQKYYITENTTPAADDTFWTSMSVGYSYGCAIASDSNAYCWSIVDILSPRLFGHYLLMILFYHV